MAIGDWKSNAAANWNDWLQKMKGYDLGNTENDINTRSEYSQASGLDQGKALFERMLYDTGAQGLLSQSVINSLRNRVSRAFMENQLLAGSEYGQIPQNFGGFLKNWMTQDKGGWGTVGDYGTRIQQLLNNIQQGRQQFQSGQTGSQLGNLYNYWVNTDQQIFQALLGYAAGTGSYGDYMQKQLRNLQLQYSVLPDQQRGDWIEYLLGNTPNYRDWNYSSR